MTAVLIVLIIIFLIFAIAAPIIFLQTRRIFREQKNYERGLKMVPLYIHLPPPSDDTEVGGRDARDVTEETISQATTIYNIIASTLQKGFKYNFYGQRHFAFEIVGTQGFVHLYAAVPIALLEVVKQAIVSAYPSARLEERAEHNIFSPIGRATGTLGGEMVLKQPFAYPIATYQDLKRDTMQALLNALGSLGKEDGAGIQILMRPADPSWTKTATALSGKKRKGEDSKFSFGGMAKDVVKALNAPPEGGKGDDKKPKELSNLEQSTLDAIDEKTRYPGYEVVIRIVVSSNISQRAQALLANIVASFALYDAPGKNGFKFVPAKDMDALVTAYIMRFFPQQQNRNILNSVELATIFHFPDQRSIPTSQLTRQDSKQVDGPRNMPNDGLLLGYNVFRGAKKPIFLSLQDRQRHMYVAGQTGTGKSTFLENLALQDMIKGNGFAFVDPHGDTAEKLLSMVPKERTEDVIYFSPADMDHPMGLNLFEFNNPDQKDFLVQETLNMLQKLYDPQHQGIMGPRYEHIFRNAALAVMADPAGGTFVDIPKLFRDPQFLKEKLSHVTDSTVLEYWQKEYPASQRSNEAGEVTAWFVSKFGAFLSNEMMRNIIGQTKSAFDLRDIMDNKKILLVNLSKGRTGDLNSKLLGMIFVMKFQAAAMSRANIPESERVDFSLYVDEFQNFSTDSFATIMSEARKYHLNLIVANQFTTQLTQEIRDAVFGNMGTIVAFRIGQNDVESIGQYFQPIFDGEDLLRVPNYNVIMRTLVSGVPTHPFSMATLPPLGTANAKLGEALKQLSALKYSRSREEVSKEINERMKTREPARPAGAGAASPFGSPAAQQRPAAPQPAKSGSFLDDWLNKRKTATQRPAAATSAPAAWPSATASPSISPAATANPLEAPASQASLGSDDSMAPAPAPSATPAPSQPFAPASASIATPSMPATTKNISSDEIEQTEVDKIAAELRHELDDSKKSTQPQPNKTHNVELKPGKDDTIFIDQDGSFHINEQTK
ncbi:MAG TPA: ATP-binding protein [Candidatus Saccharimonadales bacterium]